MATKMTVQFNLFGGAHCHLLRSTFAVVKGSMTCISRQQTVPHLHSHTVQDFLHSLVSHAAPVLVVLFYQRSMVHVDNHSGLALQGHAGRNTG